MERQKLYIKKYDWIVFVYYDTTPIDTSEILHILWSFGCSYRGIIKSYNNLRSGQYNIGMTYSNKPLKQSIMVIGKTSSLAQFLNTWQHETRHLEAHICDAFGIDLHSEEAAYLAGDIATQMHPVLMEFICCA